MSQSATGEAMNPFSSQAFRDEFEQTLDKKLKPILDMKSTVIKHDRWIERQKGIFETAVWIGSGLGALILVIVGYLLRWPH